MIVIALAIFIIAIGGAYLISESYDSEAETALDTGIIFWRVIWAVVYLGVIITFIESGNLMLMVVALVFLFIIALYALVKRPWEDVTVPAR